MSAPIARTVNNPIKVYLHLRFRMNVRQRISAIVHPKTTRMTGELLMIIPITLSRHKNSHHILSAFEKDIPIVLYL